MQKVQATTAVKLEVTAASPFTKRVAAPPPADFVIITWTAAKTGAMATIFGKGKYHFTSETGTNLTPLLLPGLILPSGEKCHAHLFQTQLSERP